ncbi:MAG: RNA-binding protein [Elusimicrobia bacterium GWA2_56_46]|nr:MAG: RNA-binding protein [Elusimicrobia bacterium GWA2_56_46]OGR54510.1 MAG: RNA-binding protein [Elusimicrobia bacterium GWC2_56_31]HBB68181.1 RNA-binding protein [Elusimicrobiota bacterium]HBW22312.1 RNA-binding protein [Elusimicrobiota bacterium]
MSKRIYVGGLPFSANDEQLSAVFASHGSVTSAKVITDKFSGQSRGFGFVEMSNDAEAMAAIEKLNGSDMEGRKLTVNEARPMEARDGGSRGGSRGGFGGGRGGRDGGGGGNRW